MSKNNNSKQADIATDNVLSKIDAIRDIIVGQDLSEIDKQILSIKDSIHDLEGRTSGDMGSLKSDLLIAIENLQNSTNDRIDQMNKELIKRLDSLKEDKVERNKLGQLFEKMGQSLKK